MGQRLTYGFIVIVTFLVTTPSFAETTTVCCVAVGEVVIGKGKEVKL